MPLSRRYSPEWAPAENATIGLDYSGIIPPGVGISSGALSIFSNVVPPVAADTDFVKGAVSVSGRALWCHLSGGVSGKDYQLAWTATDSDGNVWPRIALMLCAPTS